MDAAAESLSISTQILSMKRIQHLRSQFDTILTGHSRAQEDASLFDDLLAALVDLQKGNTANDIDYHWFGGKCKAHPYGKVPRRIVYKG